MSTELETAPTFDFALEGAEPYSVVKSVMDGYKKAVAETRWNLTVLDIHPKDASKLREQMTHAPLPWLTVRENSEIQVGHARLSLE